MGYSTLIVICLYAYVCSVHSNPEPRDPIGNCNKNTTLSYCSDCSTLAVCTKPKTTNTIAPTTKATNETLLNCISGTLCLQTSSYAACEPASEVPSCECPPTGVTSIPDAYDSQKYIICVEGTGTVEKCNNGEYYHPDTQTCEPTVVTVPPTTPPPLTCGDSTDVIPVNCTAYKICIPGSEPVVEQCEPGEIATGIRTQPCRFYEPFSCADYTGSDWFADTTNCSIGHLCIDGEERGQPLICEQDQSFDNSTKQCVTDPSGVHCSALEDCGICQDNTTRITIDCYSYYQCSDGTGETGELPFVAVLKNCPTGTYYDPVGQICSQTVPDGCEGKAKYIKS